MPLPGSAKRVRCYIDEGDRLHGQPLHLVIERWLQSHGALGATVFRGVGGFGSHGKIHPTALVDVIQPLPLVVEWVDTVERVDRLLADLVTLVGEGLVTVEDVTVVKAGKAPMLALPPDLTVREVMTSDVVTVQPATPLRTVVAGLIARDFRAVPVVDDHQRVIGIVTNSDLVERGGLRLRLDMLSALPAPEVERELAGLAAKTVTARDVMTQPAATTRPDKTVREVARRMIVERRKRLPVVDTEGALLGMISRADILRSLANHAVLSVPPLSGRPVEPSTGTVGAIMQPSVPVVTPDTSLVDVLDAVISTRLNRAVVVDRERRPLGVVTDAELIRRLNPLHRPGALRVLMSRLNVVHLQPDEQLALRAMHAERAADLMVEPVQTLNADTSIGEAIDQMLSLRRKLMPVVDGAGRLVGMVDRADLLAAVAG